MSKMPEVNRFFLAALAAAIVCSIVASSEPGWCDEVATQEQNFDLLKEIESNLAKKPDDLELQFQHAEMMGRLQRYEDEVVEANQILRKNPNLRDAFLIRAHGQGNLKKYSEANVSLDNAFALGAPTAKLMMIKAGNLKNLKMYPQAIELLNKVVKLCPAEANAYAHRSYCYNELYGPCTSGLEDLETYARLKPSDTSVIPLIDNLRKALASQKQHR